MKTNNTWLFLVLGPMKVLYQIISLWLVLGYKIKPAKWMLVQVSPHAIIYIYIIIIIWNNTPISLIRKIVLCN